MTPFKQERFKFIKRRLDAYKCVARRHLMDKFKVSYRTAQIDLRDFARQSKGRVKYDKFKKHYKLVGKI